MSVIPSVNFFVMHTTPLKVLMVSSLNQHLVTNVSVKVLTICLLKDSVGEPRKKYKKYEADESIPVPLSTFYRWQAQNLGYVV